jgi:hypothetical protein
MQFPKKRLMFGIGSSLVALGLAVSLLAIRASRADAMPASHETTPQVAAKSDVSTPGLEDQRSADPPFGAYLGACSTSADCTGGNSCASFKKRGNHCTHACQSDQECGAEGRCTKQNRCGLVQPVKTEP